MSRGEFHDIGYSFPISIICKISRKIFSILSIPTKNHRTEKCSELLYVKHLTVGDVLKQNGGPDECG